MSISTLLALFMDDTRLILSLTPISRDMGFYVVQTFCMVFFFLEWSILTFVKPGYAWSLYFLLDFVSILSMIPNIAFIYSPILSVLPGLPNAGSSSVRAFSADYLSCSPSPHCPIMIA